MQIKNLPENHKVILREKYKEVIEWIRINLSNDDEAQRDIEQFEFIVELLNKERSEEEFKKFLSMTSLVDGYRGDDFFNVFTEFDDFKPTITN